MKMNQLKQDAISGKRQDKRSRFFHGASMTVALCTVLYSTALAADDPLTIVNNMSNFVFSCIRAIGIIVLGWGLVQIGMSIQSHDASQRTQGFLGLFGGLVIAFAKEILTVIGVS